MKVQEINSKDNALIKKVRALHKQKERRRENLFIIEGWRSSEEAINSKIKIVYALIGKSFLAKNSDHNLAQKLLQNNIKVYTMPDKLIDYSADTKNPAGIILIAQQPDYNWHSFWEQEQLVENKNKPLLIIDKIRDPGNLGTIFRTAWASDAIGVILLPETADLFNPKVVRSSMGALANLPFIIAEKDKIIAELNQKGYQLIAADGNGKNNHFSANLRLKTAFVLGNEAHGISPFWLEQSDQIVKIPMKKGVESLNVAVAAGVLLYESWRQREKNNISSL